jgi:hypothetical protein
MLHLLFGPEDGVNTLLRNVDELLPNIMFKKIIMTRINVLRISNPG